MDPLGLKTTTKNQRVGWLKHPIWIIFPNFRGENNKYVKPPPRQREEKNICTLPESNSNIAATAPWK